MIKEKKQSKMQLKNNALKTPRYGLHVAWLSALIVIGAFLPILINNGGRLYLIGDYMTQQIPFMRECRRMLLSGEPFWSWNTFFGANFIGTYSFYIYGSPFFWPLLLLPESAMTIGVSIMFILKHVVAAVGAYYYLRRHVKTAHFAAIGALMYAFSSFTMDSSFYHHFIDVIALFPWLLLAVDDVLEGRRKVWLSVIVLLNALTNYYFLIGTALFVLIYLFFRIKFGGYTFRDGVRVVVFCAAGCFAAMVILLPSALCLLETSKATASGGFMKIIGKIGLCFPQTVELLRGMVLPTEGILDSANGFYLLRYASNSAFLPLFGGLFLFAALYREKNGWDRKLIKFLFILSLIPAGNGMFSLFSNINYSRWWYAFVLIMILVSINILEEDEEKAKPHPSYKKAAKAMAIIAAVALFVPAVIRIFTAYIFRERIVAATGDTLLSTGLITPYTLKTLSYIAVLVIMTAISYIPLYFAIKNKWIYKAKRVVPLVVLICFISYGAYINNEADGFYGKGDTYLGDRPAVSETIAYESRVEHITDYANYSLTTNEPGVATFHSFKSHATSEFAFIAGYKISDDPHTTPYHDTEAMQAVLSIEYRRVPGEEKTPAPYYVPMGFVYDYYLPLEGIEPTKDFSVNNARIENMAGACYLDSETAEQLSNVIKPYPGEKVEDWKAAVEAARKTAATDIKMTGSGLTAKTSGDRERLVYFSVPNDNGWTAYINGEQTEIYNVNGGFMGLIVPAGEAEIELRFETPGLKIGALVSIASIFGLAIYALAEPIIKKRKKA